MTVEQFLMYGPVQVWVIMSSAPWVGRIVAVDRAGFLFQSLDQPAGLGNATTPVFVSWSHVSHIIKLPELEKPGALPGD